MTVPHVSQVTGQLAATVDGVQRVSVSFRATHTHERSFVPTRNLLELSRQDVGLDIGDAVGSEFGPVGLDVGLLEGFSVGDNDVFGLVIGLADGLLVGFAVGLDAVIHVPSVI